MNGYSWNIPNDIKEGDKLLIEVIWETGDFFGTLKAEKLYEYTNEINTSFAIISDFELAEINLRSINAGMEFYKATNKTYPDKLSLLITPVSYLSFFNRSIPKDPFSANKADSLKLIKNGEKYILYSVGPDKKDDNAKIKYDPTNGSESAGDIIRNVND